MDRFLIILLIVVSSGCFTTRSSYKVNIGKVHQDLRVRDIGSGAQIDVGSETNLNVGTTVPISGVPSPFDLGLIDQGLNNVKEINIEEVRGSIIIEKILTDTQNINIEELLDNLYKPIDPFSSGYE